MQRILLVSLFGLTTVGLTWLPNIFGFSISLRTILVVLAFVLPIIIYSRVLALRRVFVFWSILMLVESFIQIGDSTSYRAFSLFLIFLFISLWPRSLVKKLIAIYTSTVKIVLFTSSLLLLFEFWGITAFSESYSSFWGPEWFGRSANDSQWQRSTTEFISNTRLLVYGNYQRNILLPFSFTPLGISYEPHVNMFFIIPGILLINKNRLAWFTIVLLYALIVFSLTSILSLVVCLLIYLLWQKRSGLLTFVSIMSLYLIQFALEYGLFVKLIDGGRSRDTSVSYLQHILSPNLFSEYSVIDIPSVLGTSISLFGFLVYFIIYGCLLFLFVKLAQRNILASLSLLYIILHSLKFPLHIVNYPLVYLIVIYLYDEYRLKKFSI